MAVTEAPPPNRTQIPNIVDDLGLDPYERALYVHYKRVCGENPGAYCYEATKTTAQKVKMSTGQVSTARKSLALRGLVIVQADTRPVVVTIVNIWELNTAFYKLENRPDVDGWNVEQIKRWLYDMSSDVHTVNVSSHNDSDIRSSGERILTEKPIDVHSMNQKLENVHTVNEVNNMSSDVHTVKQRSKDSLSIESNPIKESKRESIKNHTRPPEIPSFKIFVEITEYHAINKHWRGEMARIVGDKPDDLAFWRKVVIGWTGKYPTKHNVEGMLDYYQRREIPGYQKNGATPPANKSSPSVGDDYQRLREQDKSQIFNPLAP